MGHTTVFHTVRRTWTLEVRPRPGGQTLACPQCGRVPVDPGPATTRAVVLNHLAEHARAEPLPGHLRTCRCGELGCRWHPRHRGCDGAILLMISCSAGGRLWRLTDACRACLAVTDHAAAVTEPSDFARTAGEKAFIRGEPLTTGVEELDADFYWHDGALYEQI
ncbi:hypothetical protein [Streptomyces sp. MI02-7b]|uniref:hypothetical protein n=1 Tax=Streptomyces sp. MI02-7b TaxID=462941 RepID=UPI0029BC4815|nr:hypothetical protein [Streptomyces sp. MI02-7b]MDX3077868.1 hypothetical protein [Streptomyces sp. MI02-7b]